MDNDPRRKIHTKSGLYRGTTPLSRIRKTPGLCRADRRRRTRNCSHQAKSRDKQPLPRNTQPRPNQKMENLWSHDLSPARSKRIQYPHESTDKEAIFTKYYPAQSNNGCTKRGTMGTTHLETAIITNRDMDPTE